MELRMSQSVRLSQEIHLTQAQRMAVDIEGLELRRGLVAAVRGETFTPKAVCPACRHFLSDYEIMKGFKSDPTDFTTGCPKCKHRFLPRLFHTSGMGSMEVAFYCPVQTLQQLPALKDTPLEDFRSRFAAIYHSAVAHFGGLKQAFGKLGLTYAHEADLDWRKRVGSFLGKLPDTVIAALVGAGVRVIRRLRNEQGIKRYSRREHAESIAP